MNLARALDLFMGGGLALHPHNTFYADVSSDVNVRLTDDEGLDADHDGSVTIIGSASDDRLMRTFVMGLQLNLGPVKIPFHLTHSVSTDNRVASTGLYVTL